MRYKVIVAHPGKQHSFHLASAMKKNRMLHIYSTTVYDKNSSLLMKIVKRCLDSGNRKRADSRKNLDLTDAEVIQFCEFSGLIEIFLARFDKSKIFYNFWHYFTSDRFGRKIAKLAIKENVDAVIMYDTNALSCFEKLKNEAPQIKRIMDSSAANRLYMKQVYENDMEICPKFATKLKNEVSDLWNPKSIERCTHEIACTEYFLVPSEFVKKSFLYSGITEKQIIVCPYGTNFEPKKNMPLKLASHQRLEAIYVGNVTEMKGIYYLLEAINLIPTELIHLTVVGAYDNSSHIFDPYMDYITFTGRVQHNEVKRLLDNADVFVFASLGEGLSLAVLEALACGLPCIVTEHSGANDAIIDGENGFVIPIQDIESLREKLMWFIQNMDKIPEMKRAAISSAEKYTWQCYEKRTASAIETLLEVNKKSVY